MLESPAVGFKIGVQLHPHHATIDQLRRAWREADALGVDSIWNWDHFFPLSGARGPSFEAWTVLGAMAVDTSRARLGVLVTCSGYRNSDLLAFMASTVDHLSGGRAILGIGSGWFERDFREYGYEFGTAASRLRDLEAALRRIKARIAKLNPPPVAHLPILIGGSGEQVTLRLVAQYADMWNGHASEFTHKNRVLDEWCNKVGRDPRTIERTVSVNAERWHLYERLLAAGADHVILTMDPPYVMEPARQLLAARERTRTRSA